MSHPGGEHQRVVLSLFLALQVGTRRDRDGVGKVVAFNLVSAIRASHG